MGIVTAADLIEKHGCDEDNLKTEVDRWEAVDQIHMHGPSPFKEIAEALMLLHYAVDSLDEHVHELMKRLIPDEDRGAGEQD